MNTHPQPRSSVAVLLAATMVALAAPSALSADLPVGLAATLAPDHAQNRVIVRYEPGTSRARKARSIASVDVAQARRLSPRAKDTVVVKLEKGQTVADAIVEIGSQPGVAYVEPDYKLQAAATSNDTYYVNGQLWGMYGDATSPSNPYGSGAAQAWASGHTGAQGVYVGIIDEGLRVDHADLAANVWTNPWETVNGIDDDGNGYVDDVNGWDFYHDDATVYDGGTDDHGTHVAGTVGARGGNGVGVAGVNWRVTLISAKFLGPGGSGTTTDAVRAIDYITDLKQRHGLNIVATNNSWSGEGYSRSLELAINRAGDAGIVFVAAAGNNGVDIDSTPRYPAANRCNTRANGSARGWDCIIAVANLKSNGDLSGSSNWGDTHVDLAAPGTGIVSTVPNGYTGYSGTSMAAPHVAGAVALCASVDGTLGAKQLRARVFESVRSMGSLAGVTATGGRLDVAELIERCVPPPATTVTTYVDDRDPGFKRFGSGWKQGSTGYDGHHFYASVNGGKRTAYASWKPSLPAGKYTVQVWVPGQHATSRKAAYKIKTADGWVKRVRNQYKRRGSWVSLGAHRLTNGAVVQLANDTGEARSTGRKLAYDAVRFIPFGLAAQAERR